MEGQTQVRPVQLVEDLNDRKLPEPDIFLKPFALLCFSPRQKVNLFPRTVINYFYYAFASGYLQDDAFVFSLAELLRVLDIKSNNRSHFYESLFGLKVVEAWINPFALGEPVETRRLFESVLIRSGEVYLSPTLWLKTLLQRDQDRFHLDMGSIRDLRSPTDMTLFEICCAFREQKATPALPISRWREILGAASRYHLPAAFKSRLLTSRFPVLGKELGRPLRLVSSRSDRSILQIRIDQATEEAAQDLLPEFPKSCSSTPVSVGPGLDDIENFGHLVQSWNDLHSPFTSVSAEEAPGVPSGADEKPATAKGLPAAPVIFEKSSMDDLKMDSPAASCSDADLKSNDDAIHRLIAAKTEVARIRELLLAAQAEEREAALGVARELAVSYAIKSPDIV